MKARATSTDRKPPEQQPELVDAFDVWGGDSVIKPD